MVYYFILICVLLYYVLKRFSKQSYPYERYLVKVHFWVLGIWVIELFLFLLGWRFAGAYSGVILFGMFMCSGILAARFYAKDDTTRWSEGYFKLLRIFIIFYVVGGIVPIISGYGGGFAKDIFSLEYTSYPTGQGYVFRTVKQGAGSCLDLHLYEQFGILERDIPISKLFEASNDCFDPLEFGIVTANANEIAAEAKYRGFGMNI